MVKPTLVVLAAGMGSRYGSLKQMDGVGPCGEAIIDYSIYDAIRAGFGKVVFVIRHSFAKEFIMLELTRRELISSAIASAGLMAASPISSAAASKKPIV